jgi:predicted TIM-barrel fold metal-dependent hydrolase
VIALELVSLIFGQDYPYGIGFWDVDANIAGLTDAEFLSVEEKEAVYWRNSEELWKGKISDH